MMSALAAIAEARTATNDASLSRMLTHYEVERFNVDYCRALDEQRLSDWAEMFTENAFYVVISRENDDHKMPVGLIYCEGRAMIRDRAFALEKTAMFAPRYLRHMVSNLSVVENDDGTITAGASYIVLQVLFDRPDATIHQLGRYEDVFQRVNGELKLLKRRCIYDSLLVPNALCLPV